MFWIIVLLEDPTPNQFLFPGSGSQIQILNFLVFYGVHDTMDLNKVLSAFGGKTAPQHHKTFTSTIFTYRLFSV